MMQDAVKQLMFWGKETPIKFVFTKDHSGTINQTEQDAYDDFTSHISKYDKESLATLKLHIHTNAAEILAYTSLPAIPRDVMKIVTIEAVRFYPSGSFAIFCNTSWDSHGVALYCENGSWEALPPDQLWFRI